MTKPRLREKGGGEVAIPAYEAMQENGMSARMLDVLLRGISTRQYAEVDGAGHKHGLGIQPGATENAAAVEDLLQQFVARGVDPKAKRLFVIDGAKALRAGINQVFGAQHPVQRCRNHKIENVGQRLPEEQKAQVKAAMRASYKLQAKDGMARLRKLADWLEQESPAAANSLREGLEECFTLNRLGIPPSLHRCLATTNLIESPQSGCARGPGG